MFKLKEIIANGIDGMKIRLSIINFFKDNKHSEKICLIHAIFYGYPEILS